MDKRENVIGHLDILRTWCAVNPKYGMALSVEDCDKAVGWLDDAIMMLKEQEPVEPIRMNHDENKYRDHYRCPICKEDLSYEQNYCPDCGRAVKWE